MNNSLNQQKSFEDFRVVSLQKIITIVIYNIRYVICYTPVIKKHLLLKSDKSYY